MSIKTEVYQGIPADVNNADIPVWIEENIHLFPDAFSYHLLKGYWKGVAERSVCFIFIGEYPPNITSMDKYAKDFHQDAYLVNLIQCDDYLHQIRHPAE